MASTAGTCHWVSTAPDGIGTTDEVFSSRPRCLSRQSSALPAPLDRAVQMGFHAPGLDPHPSKCFASRPLTYGRNLPLCKFEPMWTCTTCTADQTGLPFSLAFSEPSPTSFSAFSLFAELVSPLMPIELCCAQSAHALCSACCPLSPLGGGGAWHQKKKKVRRNECALGPFEPSWCFNVRVKEHTHSFLGLVPTPLMSKKKMVVGRMTTHASYICYAASRWLRPCLLLLPGGALFADRDGLSTAVSAFGRFLRSIFFCINYFLIQPFLYSGS